MQMERDTRFDELVECIKHNVNSYSKPTSISDEAVSEMWEFLQERAEEIAATTEPEGEPNLLLNTMVKTLTSGQYGAADLGKPASFVSIELTRWVKKLQAQQKETERRLKFIDLHISNYGDWLERLDPECEDEPEKDGPEPYDDDAEEDSYTVDEDLKSKREEDR